MFKRLPLLAALMLLALPATTWADAPGQLPVQGQLTDASGTAINDVFAVDFTIYADAGGTVSLWTEQISVNFVEGYFTAYLGENNPIDLSVFRDNGDAYLGVKIAGDDEMTPFKLATSPFAGFAQYAANAGDLTDAAKLQIVSNVTTQLNNDGSVHTKYSDAEAVAAVAADLNTVVGFKDNTNSVNHDRYTDAEAVNALSTHTGDVAAHHTKYLDSDAVTAISTADTYVLNAGDTMTGDLTIRKSVPALILDDSVDGNDEWALRANGEVFELLEADDPVGTGKVLMSVDNGGTIRLQPNGIVDGVVINTNADMAVTRDISSGRDLTVTRDIVGRQEVVYHRVLTDAYIMANNSVGSCTVVDGVGLLNLQATAPNGKCIDVRLLPAGTLNTAKAYVMTIKLYTAQVLPALAPGASDADIYFGFHDGASFKGAWRGDQDNNPPFAGFEGVTSATVLTNPSEWDDVKGASSNHDGDIRYVEATFTFAANGNAFLVLDAPKFQGFIPYRGQDNGGIADLNKANAINFALYINETSSQFNFYSAEITIAETWAL